jgi:hypothetical protein
VRFTICRSTICRSQDDCDRFLLNLKLTPCPHCKLVGALNRHGFLKAFQGNDLRDKSIRAHRVFCSNRARNQGCGRTFSVWIADNIKRLFLSASQLSQFLLNAATTGNKRKAFNDLNCDMSDSAPYRIWKRFHNAQAAIRTALSTICLPPECQPNKLSQNQFGSDTTSSTLSHLVGAFAIAKMNEQNLTLPLNPIAVFQVATQAFFI